MSPSRKRELPRLFFLMCVGLVVSGVVFWVGYVWAVATDSYFAHIIRPSPCHVKRKARTHPSASTAPKAQMQWACTGMALKKDRPL